MLKIITVLVVFAITGCASICDTRYAKIGAGYKFQEKSISKKNIDGTYSPYKSSPISARLEGGCKKNSYLFGVSHHSQWSTGAPFNDDWEYHKTELFVDKEWEF